MDFGAYDTKAPWECQPPEYHERSTYPYAQARFRLGVSGIALRLHEVRAQVAAALARVGDPDREIVIVAVTKGHPAEVVLEVAQAGLLDVGENRVQEAKAKIPVIEETLRWHLVGHLQRNKATLAAQLFQTIHSVDSIRLVDALAATGADFDVFLQINVSGEDSKFGSRSEGARELWRAALNAESLRVAGLMTMAPVEGAARPVFRALRELRDDLSRTGDGPPLECLSMGMSGDYGIAVEEGATHLRIGTALVGLRRGTLE